MLLKKNLKIVIHVLIPLINLENIHLISFFSEVHWKFSAKNVGRSLPHTCAGTSKHYAEDKNGQRDSVRLSNARDFDFAHTFSPSRCKPHNGLTCPPHLSPRATSRTPRTPRSSHCATQTSRRSLVAIPGQRVRPSRRPGGWSPPVVSSHAAPAAPSRSPIPVTSRLQEGHLHLNKCLSFRRTSEL